MATVKINLSESSILGALEERGLILALEAFHKLRGSSKATFLQDLATIDFGVLEQQQRALELPAQTDVSGLTPPDLHPPSLPASASQATAQECAWDAYRSGDIAIATVAGGQASRLGFDGPKGAFPLSPISGASLFQIFAGQIKRLRELAQAEVHWVIQTGPGNDLETKEFFAKRNWFGLGSSSIHFACQGTLPALSPEGQLLLAAPDRLFRNPDGHGGFYRALKSSGALTKLKDHGVSTLYYCQVDNPLALIGDPVFLGQHLLADAQMSAKVVEKVEPSEKVGLLVCRDKRTLCIEYSDMPQDLCSERAPDGGLLFRAGNIAIHAFALDFVQEMAEAQLPLHLAHKQILALHGQDSLTENQGVKFESFVFDALALAERTVVQLATRQDEFSPLKNRSGHDSIVTSRKDLSHRNLQWAANSGRFDDLPGSGPFELESSICLSPTDLETNTAHMALKGRQIVTG